MKKRKNYNPNRRTASEKVIFTIVFILFLLYALMLIYPIVWGIFSSLKNINDFFDKPFLFNYFVSDDPTYKFKLYFENYISAFNEISDEGISFIEMAYNSLWFSLGSALINMEFTCAFAYVLNKYKFKGRNFLYGLCLFMLSVPIGASFVSTYRLYYSLNLANSYIILITAANVYGMNLILFHSYWNNISKAYSEAAQIDGANFYQTYFKAMRPQATPMMLTLGILMFISKWNDYMSPLLYLPKMPTLATGLYRYQLIAERDGNYPVLFAGLIICLIPIMIIFAIFQDKMLGNISIGGLKG